MGGSSAQLSIIVKLVDEATGAMRGVASEFKNASGMISAQAVGASTAVALGMAAGATAVAGLGYAALKAAGDMEQTRVAFTTMLGSAQEANAFIDQLVSFAKRTPFTLVGLETASKQLLAYGIAQDQVLPDLKALGDVAAGVGMDKLPNLILAFGQVKAATHLTGMELRQFTEAGVPLLDQLSQELGKPVAEIQKMISAGQISFPMVEQALKGLTTEGGRFNNLMDKQSHTLEGMMSNLQDAWNIFLTREGQKLLEWAKLFVDAAIYIVQNVLPAWIDRIDALAHYLNEHRTLLYMIAGAIAGALTPALVALSITLITVTIPAFIAAAIALAPFIIGGAIIGGIVAGALWIVKHWDVIKQKLGELGDWFAQIWSNIKDTVQSAADYVMAKLQPLINLINTITSGLSGITAKASSLGSSMLSTGLSIIPKFAEGGIVTGPTLGLVGEAGPEAIIPLSKAGSHGGTTFNVTITGNTISSSLDVRGIAAQVSEEIMRTLRTNQKLAT